MKLFCLAMIKLLYKSFLRYMDVESWMCISYKYKFKGLNNYNKKGIQINFIFEFLTQTN